MRGYCGFQDADNTRKMSSLKNHVKTQRALQRNRKEFEDWYAKAPAVLWCRRHSGFGYRFELQYMENH